MTHDQTTQLQGWLDRMRAGDDAARRGLLDHAYRRLETLAHARLEGFPRVRRDVETGDVLNDAVHRLERALQEVRPATVREFFGLASRHIRWVLLELARERHPIGLVGPGTDDASPELTDDATGPATLAEQTELHEQVEALPPEEREVFDLLFYQGLQQSEAAALLGVSERTVKRRWRAARLALARALGGDEDDA